MNVSRRLCAILAFELDTVNVLPVDPLRRCSGDSSSRFSCMLVRRSKMTVTLQRYATQLISGRLLANANDGSVQEATA